MSELLQRDRSGGLVERLWEGLTECRFSRAPNLSFLVERGKRIEVASL